MRYKITRQTLFNNEIVIALLSEASDVTRFIDALLTNDLKEEAEVIYRLYEANQLTKEWDAHGLASRAKRSTALSDAIDAPFRITLLQPTSQDKLLAEFATLTDAKIFIAKKLLMDASLQNDHTYRLFDSETFLAKFNQANANSLFKPEKKARMVFKPTPIPRNKPKGGPTSYFVEEDKDEGEE